MDHRICVLSIFQAAQFGFFFIANVAAHARIKDGIFCHSNLPGAGFLLGQAIGAAEHHFLIAWTYNNAVWAVTGNIMGDQDQTELRVRLAELEIEHADLGRAIDALTQVGSDALCIQRLKKKKLALKDEIAKLHDMTTPDIIA